MATTIPGQTAIFRPRRLSNVKAFTDQQIDLLVEEMGYVADAALSFGNLPVCCKNARTSLFSIARSTPFRWRRSRTFATAARPQLPQHAGEF